MFFKKTSSSLWLAGLILILHPSARAQTLLAPHISARSSAPVATDSWLGGDANGVSNTTVTEEAVNRLTQILQTDPAGADLVEKANRHAEATLHDQFWKAISVCAATIDPNTQGQTEFGTFTNVRRERDVEDSAFNLLANGSTNQSASDLYYKDIFPQMLAQTGILAGTPFAAHYFPDVVLLKTYVKPPGICLQKELTVRDAVAVLYHEMVHYISTDYNLWVDVSKFTGEQDYEQNKVLSTGDEVDAYISQWSYQVRIGDKRLLARQVQPFFTASGTFIPTDGNGTDNRQVIARLILDGPIFASGEGYHELRYLGEYKGSLINQSQSEASLLSLFQDIQKTRSSNIPYYQQQYDQAKSRSSKEGQRGQAILQEDQKSVARITQEENQCSARIIELNSLMKAFNSEFEESSQH